MMKTVIPVSKFQPGDSVLDIPAKLLYNHDNHDIISVYFNNFPWMGICNTSSRHLSHAFSETHQSKWPTKAGAVLE